MAQLERFIVALKGLRKFLGRPPRIEEIAESLDWSLEKTSLVWNNLDHYYGPFEEVDGLIRLQNAIDLPDHPAPNDVIANMLAIGSNGLEYLFYKKPRETSVRRVPYNKTSMPWAPSIIRVLALLRHVYGQKSKESWCSIDEMRTWLGQKPGKGPSLKDYCSNIIRHASERIQVRKNISKSVARSAARTAKNNDFALLWIQEEPSEKSDRPTIVAYSLNPRYKLRFEKNVYHDFHRVADRMRTSRPQVPHMLPG